VQKRRTSLTDVARAAGVGLATASRALTGNDEVGAATRARILQTAAEMGYQPSSTAQALRTGRTRLIELAVTSSWHESVLQALFEACEDSGYHLLLTRIPDAGSALRPGPAVDARILLDPPDLDSAPGESDVPVMTFRTAGLSDVELVEASRSLVHDLLSRIGA